VARVAKLPYERIVQTAPLASTATPLHVTSLLDALDVVASVAPLGHDAVLNCASACRVLRESWCCDCQRPCAPAAHQHSRRTKLIIIVHAKNERTNKQAEKKLLRLDKKNKEQDFILI